MKCSQKKRDFLHFFKTFPLYFYNNYITYIFIVIYFDDLIRFFYILIRNNIYHFEYIVFVINQSKGVNKTNFNKKSII